MRLRGRGGGAVRRQRRALQRDVRAGEHTDYAKPAEVLNKLEPPYFAIPFPTDGNMAGGLVTLTGMFCDRHGQVRAQNTFAPIEGLYAAGNCMGGRFPLQYTSPINGVSIGFAQTSGYLVGEYLGGK
ncbi:MAG: FAD-binding protein [Eggerthella lenta]